MSFQTRFSKANTAGTRVRSKSEVIISNLLYKSNIKYKYEEKFPYEDHKWLEPDFFVSHFVVNLFSSI